MPSSISRRSQHLFQAVPESDNTFYPLWNHRFDYIYAEHPKPGESPVWRTESRHPLSDRLLLQGACLYGVRHGSTASYALIDVDRGSPYHPSRDPIAFSRLRAALEPLGLVADLLLTSSDSDGLHVYLPLEGKVASWKLGIAITTLLENAGFKVIPGWLEVFPNRKSYAADGTKTRFNAHRLPLQYGSYLLNDDLEPTYGSHESFVRQWHCAAGRNALSKAMLRQVLKRAKRKSYRITGKAQKFLNDLNAEVESGWTGQGQTNRLLGRIAMRSFIFGHILYADKPLEGRELVADIVRVAKSLPGFYDFCNHRHELVKKAKGWVRQLAKSHYFPYSSNKSLKVKGERAVRGEDKGEEVSNAEFELTWNEQQAIAARQRVQEGVLDLCRQAAMPELATHRYKLLCSYKVSARTLYKNSDLWHPDHIQAVQQRLMQKVAFELSDNEAEAFCAVGAAASAMSTSLLEIVGGNTPAVGTSSDWTAEKNGDSCVIGGNASAVAASSRIEIDSRVQQQVVRSLPPKQLVLEIQERLACRQAQQLSEVEQNQATYRAQRRQQNRTEHVAMLHKWAASDDPILVAEARRQLERLGTMSQ